MKKVFIAVLCLLLSASVLLGLVACDITPRDLIPTSRAVTTDKMRTYYQIFPISFADSNGDGKGDLQGIIDKLDYVDSLGYDGIWLTPVHPSPTYHKYDVLDYYDIDKQLGTLADYDALVEACHDRGMTILMDTVFNHSAVDNEWFEQCMWAHERGKIDNKYYHFYNVKEIGSDADIPSGWARYNSHLAYECQFWTGMPDFNLGEVLEHPYGDLAQELKAILKFWLVDHKVDGLRLDAVTSYFSGNKAKNTEFLTWLNDTAKELKPDCYIVGEGAWGGIAENMQYQDSGVDSFFNFQHGYTAMGNLSYAARLGKAAYLYKIDEDNKMAAMGGIPATFISNHDVSRASGVGMSTVYPNSVKIMYGMMAMCYGTTFGYYGDEVGMTVLLSSDGTYHDEDKRQPMPWGDKYQCKPVPGSKAGTDEQKYPLGTVKDQEADPNSLLNYVKKANAIRRAFPVIARNVAKVEDLNRDRDMVVVTKGEGKEKIFIVFNANVMKQTYTVDIKRLGEGLTLGATLSVEGIPTLDKGVLTMPAQSFAILVTK